jgi:PIN domain nuclease of toxin-antitoxin system
MYLLDTHALLWYLEGNPLLGSNTVNAIENQDNRVCVSIVSFWELAIKLSIGKLTLNNPLAAAMEQVRQLGFEILRIETPHILQIETLPLHHRDPFDRLIIAQAMVENLILISRDAHFSKYPVQTLWG